MRGAKSAPTARVLDILELIARCGKPLRYTDIVRELGLNESTAHTILKTLCDYAWLARDPAAKTFTLGPALAVVASQADAMRPVVTAARDAATGLAKEFNCAASVVERTGDTLILTAYAAAEGLPSPGYPGDHLPYAPPYGPSFAAWAPQEEADAWIGRGTPGQPRLRARLLDYLAETRHRGFSVDWSKPALAELTRLAGALRGDSVPATVRENMAKLLADFITVGLLPEGDPDRQSQPVMSIAAPVFGPDGRVLLNLSLHPFRPLSRRELAATGRRLAQAAGSLGHPQRAASTPG
jgi:DNA-binding IclR family transcriptional regulator